METLIIDRTKWRTGGEGKHKTGVGTTALINDSGFMCCLGFECLRRGLEKDSIFGMPDPEHIVDEADIDAKLFGNMVDGKSNSEWVDEAIKINDNEDTSLAEKEEAITALFEEQNIEVQFIN